MPTCSTSRPLGNAAALLCIFLALGLGTQISQKDYVEANSSNCENFASEQGNVKYDRSCLCQGTPKMKRKDGTKCMKSEIREDNEESARSGKCQNGTCVLNVITKKCEESKAPKLKHGDKPPFGCVFFCDTSAGFYGFFPVGTKCEHRVNRTHYVNGTCKDDGQGKRICTEDLTTPPAC
uniref:Putative secreted protein n=1 Tax=Amblyomma triste TaxID=251400 RepID=A0A023G1E9_AMBTT